MVGLGGGNVMSTCSRGRSRAVVAAVAAVIAGCGIVGGAKESEKPKVKRGPDLGPSGKPALSANNGQTCGLHGSGSLYCWGRHADLAPKGTYRRIAVGFEHACALRAEDPGQ